MDEKRTSRRRLRSRRIAALLAAGAVLGVGAIGTIAAWTDNEEATGSFGASVFDTESQSAGSPAYASRPTAPGNVLTFTATAMSPSVSYYAWLNVRTTPATTVAGTVALTAITPSGALAPALEYRMVRMASASPGSTCAAAAFTGTPVFVAGAAAAYLPVTQVPTTPVASPIAAAGASIGYCVEVRVSPTAASSYQGSTATIQWSFTATSAS
ncbi:MAG: SipW-dependent-type signal peptide-containing protein [Microbacteriaceae bacterium]